MILQGLYTLLTSTRAHQLIFKIYIKSGKNYVSLPAPGPGQAPQHAKPSLMTSVTEVSAELKHDTNADPVI